MVKPLQSIDPLKAFQFHNVLKQAGFFLSGIIMAKWGLSTANIGIYEYWMFFVTTISYFWVNGLIQEYLARQKDKDKDSHLGLFFGAFMIFSLICILLVIIIKLAGFQLFEDVLPVGLLVLFILFHIPSYLVENTLMVRKNIKAQVLYAGFGFSAQILSIVIPLVFGWGLNGIFLAIVIVAGFKFLYLISLIPSIGEVFKLKQSWKLIAGALPFIGYYIVSGSSTLIDGWIVQIHYIDQSVFAIYKYGARDLPFLTTMALTLGSGLVASVARDKEQSIGEIRNRSARLMHICFPIAGVLMLASSWIFPNLLNPSFAASAVIFNVYLLLLTTRLLYPQTLLAGLGYSKFLFRNALVELAINAIVSLILFEFIGLIGIAFGTVAGNIYDKANSAYYLYKKEGIAFKQYTPLSIYSAYSVGLIILFVLSQLIQKH